MVRKPLIFSSSSQNKKLPLANEPKAESSSPSTSKKIGRKERKPKYDSPFYSDPERKKIRELVEIYYDVQDVRIASFGRLRSVGIVKGVNPEAMCVLEDQIKSYIWAYVKEQPIYREFLINIKGIGPVLAGGIISYLDPYCTQHVSSFWKYCGLHVENGLAVKRHKGEKLDYNPTMKVLAWKIGDSFIKQRTPFYRDLYDKYKVEENKKLNDPISNPSNCPMYTECHKRLKPNKNGILPKDPCKAHIHHRAMRKMVKRFLCDLWVAWRGQLGLPVTPPYEHRNEKNWRY